ncbi:MAG: gluconate 2-dehydrogenase subunit 3 family protein [Gemmatimonadota bacterium]|nr:gluconate 2-dehydrogenase subunit 3 family protein [Gemmatimonadota bacterium]
MPHRESQSRRSFLVDAARLAAAGLLTFELQLLVGCARDTTGSEARFTHLSATEGRTLRAFAAQIIPSNNGTPGADEAGAAYFVDRAFGMPFFAESATVVRSGLADLDARARSGDGRRDFASASDPEQIAIMHAIEATPFFASARMLVIIGTLADAAYGGNRGGAGWSLLQLDHRPSFNAPYGWYDAHDAPTVAARAT